MSTLTVPKPEARGEWLRARHPYFNASDAGALYSVHPHRNLGDVATEKLADEPPDLDPTDAMDRGNRIEPILLDWLGDALGVRIQVPDVLYTNGRLMATLDGTSDDLPDDEWAEAKSTAYHWPEPPDHVYWQVCGQAAASGRRRCHVVWIDASMRFQTKIVTPAPEHVEDVRLRAERFMAFIDMGMVPEGVQLQAEHVARLHPEPVAGKFVDLDDEGLQAVVLWEQRRQERLAAEKAETTAKDAVANLLMDAEGGRYDGRLLLTWKANKPSERADFKALEADHPELVASYRRSIRGARVLRATKELSK